MSNEEVKKYRELSGDTNPNTPISRIGGYLDGYEKALEQEPKWDRLYSWLNDMRLGIAPDETTPDDERNDRLAQVDVIDDIMEWMVEEMCLRT